MTHLPRIAAFVSHVHGHAVLERLLAMQETLRVVLVATDDPEKSYCNAEGRIWRYDKGPALRRLVPDLAERAGLHAFTGPVRKRGGEFHRRFAEARPDALIATVFGQRIPGHLLDHVGGRAWNIHPVIAGRPLSDTRGPEAAEIACRAGAGSMQMLLHVMTEEFDRGDEVARSGACPLPPMTSEFGETILEAYRRMAPLSAELAARTLPRLLHRHHPQLVSGEME